MLAEVQKYLKKLRQKGLTAREIAKRLGVCEDTIANWERGPVLYPRTRVVTDLRRLAA